MDDYIEEYIEFIEQNLDKINWNNLSLNPAAIRLLKANPNKINWITVGGLIGEYYYYYYYYLKHMKNNTSYILK